MLGVQVTPGAHAAGSPVQTMSSVWASPHDAWHATLVYSLNWPLSISVNCAQQTWPGQSAGALHEMGMYGAAHCDGALQWSPGPVGLKQQMSPGLHVPLAHAIGVGPPVLLLLDEALDEELDDELELLDELALLEELAVLDELTLLEALAVLDELALVPEELTALVVPVAPPPAPAPNRDSPAAPPHATNTPPAAQTPSEPNETATRTRKRLTCGT